MLPCFPAKKDKTKKIIIVFDEIFLRPCSAPEEEGSQPTVNPEQPPFIMAPAIWGQRAPLASSFITPLFPLMVPLAFQALKTLITALQFSEYFSVI